MEWGPSTYAVFGFIALPTTEVRGARMEEQGAFNTIEGARECVQIGRLTHWEIWQGDHIVEESDPEGTHYVPSV